MGRLAKSPHIQNARSIAVAALIPGDTESNRPSYARPGTMRFNTDEELMEFWNGNCWVTIPAAGLVEISKDAFTGDGVETDFTMSNDVDLDEDVLVFVGGVYQNPTTAYTVSADTISFTSPPPLSEDIIVLHGYNSTHVTTICPV